MSVIKNKHELKKIVEKKIKEVKLIDIHTHLFSASFDELLLWGIDELLTYHYLVAEFFRSNNTLSYKKFWKSNKKEQADLIWQTLFIDNSPISEAARGVITTLNALGIDTKKRDLNKIRKYFKNITTQEYIDKVFKITNIKEVIMTNDPLDEIERKKWEKGIKQDSRFKTALRLDTLLNNWKEALIKLKSSGYNVKFDFSGNTINEIKRFIRDWIKKMNPVYLPVSFPPDFNFPEDSSRGRIIEEVVLPVCKKENLAFALMIGVKRQVNPSLRLAGDSLGKADIKPIEYLCSNYPKNKFLTLFQKISMNYASQPENSIT
jgi:hypothetical protein